MNYHNQNIMHFTHICLRVVNIEISKKYYRHVLGLSVLSEEKDKVVFTANMKDPLLTIISKEGLIARESNATGLYHFALLFSKRSDLANFFKSLLDKNIPYGAADHLVSEALYLKDPDGNEIEIYIDKDPNTWTWEDSEVEMASLPLDYQSLLKDVTEPNWSKLPKDTIMGHIHLFSYALNPMQDFYEKALGFSLVSRFGDQAMFLSKENYHHHLAFNTWKGLNTKKASKDAAGLEYATLTIKNADERKDLINKLEAKGYPVLSESDYYYVLDPEDNKIILETY